MRLSEEINSYVDEGSGQLEENFFRAITDYIHDAGYGNAETKKVKEIQKNLTKQVWSRYFLFKKRRKEQLKAKGFNTVILDKKFFDDFMKSMDVDDKIKRNVRQQVAPQLKKLDELFKKYKKKEISDDQLKELLDRNGVALARVAGDVINAISLNSAIEYMDQYMDVDMSDLPDGVLRSGLKTLGKGTSKFSDHIINAIGNRSGGRK